MFSGVYASIVDKGGRGGGRRSQSYHPVLCIHGRFSSVLSSLRVTIPPPPFPCLLPVVRFYVPVAATAASRERARAHISLRVDTSLSLSLSLDVRWFARSMGTRHPDADDRTSCSPLDPFHDKDLSSIPATRLHRVTIRPSLNGSSRLSRCYFVLFAPEPFRRHEPPPRRESPPPPFSGRDRTNFPSQLFEDGTPRARQLYPSPSS